VVGAFDAGDKTDEEVAELFQVGEATVHRWKRLERETGSQRRAVRVDDARGALEKVISAISSVQLPGGRQLQ
jgi:transposase